MDLVLDGSKQQQGLARGEWSPRYSTCTVSDDGHKKEGIGLKTAGCVRVGPSTVSFHSWFLRLTNYSTIVKYYVNM